MKQSDPVERLHLRKPWGIAFDDMAKYSVCGYMPGKTGDYWTYLGCWDRKNAPTSREEIENVCRERGWIK